MERVEELLESLRHVSAFLTVFILGIAVARLLIMRERFEENRPEE